MSLVNEIDEQNIFQKSHEGSGSFAEIECDLKSISDLIGSENIRQNPIGLPEVAERDLVRHYSKLAERTFSVDANFYPLGSCTMKYNPKVNEEVASLPGFSLGHPLLNDYEAQGFLEVFYELDNNLSFICGMDAFSLQPAAGAQGELAALMIANNYFHDRGESRKKVVIPDSSHGTNAASASLCGLNIVTIPSKDGEVDLDALAKECDDDLAVFMLTNPNTLGLFEKNIEKVCQLVHDVGALTYCDGANLNALLGIARPGDMGFDMMHVNVHKTLSTPHGGGGPGAGPVGVKDFLIDYLPGKRVVKKDDGLFSWNRNDKCIGDMKAFWGNFGVLLRANVYIDSLGFKGLFDTSKSAIIAANYLKSKLVEYFDVPYNRHCMHEFVMQPCKKNSPAKTSDIAKRLLDFSIHSPTVYFPLIVKEAIMIEPTETENIQVLDHFVSIMCKIAEEASISPEKLKEAPWFTFRRRLDEVTAARKPVLSWQPKPN